MTDNVKTSYTGPVGLHWTSEKAQKAANKDVFVYIQSEDNEDKNTTFRKLTGAQREWSNGNNNYIVVQGDYRMCGDRAQIEKVFRANGFSMADLKSDLVITSADTETIKQTKDVEQEESRRDRMSKYTPPQIVQFYLHHKSLKNTTEAVQEQKEEGSPKGGGRGRSPLKGRAKTSLSEKYNSLGGGQYLDISNMTDTGAKTSVVAMPGPKSKKHVIENFVTNKVDRYQKALELLGKTPSVSSVNELTEKLLPEISAMDVGAATSPPGTPKAVSPVRTNTIKKLPISKPVQVRKKA